MTTSTTNGSGSTGPSPAHDPVPDPGPAARSSGSGGVAHRHPGGGDLAARVQALSEALQFGGNRLPEDADRRARSILERVDERLRLSADHTVVALAGATGSGKSSLLNAIAGLDIATTGARRPTTSAVSACVWGTSSARLLLDWLAVPQRNRTRHESPLDLPGHTATGAGSSLQAQQDDSLAGLVLLDLPDHDSTEVTHRLEVDRLVELVDVFIWVTDPQKYADVALHRRYLAPLAGQDPVTLVVLNHADRLSSEALDVCRADLERLIRADGLATAEVRTTSAVAGRGVDV
ncbi:MAG: dynamin family protein, partial [Angustibacter sp.]